MSRASRSGRSITSARAIPRSGEVASSCTYGSYFCKYAGPPDRAESYWKFESESLRHVVRERGDACWLRAARPGTSRDFVGFWRSGFFESEPETGRSAADPHRHARSSLRPSWAVRIRPVLRPWASPENVPVRRRKRAGHEGKRSRRRRARGWRAGSGAFRVPMKFEPEVLSNLRSRPKPDSREAYESDYQRTSQAPLATGLASCSADCDRKKDRMKSPAFRMGTGALEGVSPAEC